MKTTVIQVSPVISTHVETLSAAQMQEISNPNVSSAYVLGPDDVVDISVYNHPELNPGTNDGTDSADYNNPGPANNNGSSLLITSDGTVQMPLVGSIQLGGLTLAQAKARLTQAYTPFVSDADVTVNLQQPRSMRYYLLGAFSQPGIKYPNHPLTLLEALALGGSVDIPSADLYQAYVAQGDTKLPVDLYQLMIQGDLSQNILLSSGDSIVIPSSTNENAFVFGAVTKPGAVGFDAGKLNLLQALSGAGLDLQAMTNSRLSDVRVIRAGGRSAEFYVVNAEMILNGQAGPFDLRPGDIIYVPPTAVATWNQALQQLLPSLQTISAVLNPFVSIAYLSRNR